MIESQLIVADPSLSSEVAFAAGFVDTIVENGDHSEQEAIWSSVELKESNAHGR
jgi:hypothetical protein